MVQRNVVGVILAAGLSGRMKSFKPLVKYKGKSFLLTITEKLLHVCNKIIIVSGFKRELVEREVQLFSSDSSSQLQVVFNPDFEKGMFTSLKYGVRKIEKEAWTLYHFVDQPDLPLEFYVRFVAQIDGASNWIQPIHKGRKGHPILFDSKVREEILHADDFSTLKDISSKRTIKKKLWETSYPQIFSDIDTREDYERLLR